VLAEAASMTQYGMMLEAFKASIPDGKAIISRRLLIAIVLALATFGLSLDVVHAGHSVRPVTWLIYPGLLSLTALIYADARRLVLSKEYRLTFADVWRLAAIYLISVGLLLVSVAVLAALMLLLHTNIGLRIVLGQAVGYIIIMVIGARILFAYYALKDYGVLHACLRSWSLTGTPTLLSTLSVYILFYIPYVALNGFLSARPSGLGPTEWTALKVGGNFAILLVMASLTYPFFARWMLYCERLHSS
jgi:hypothetical protein